MRIFSCEVVPSLSKSDLLEKEFKEEILSILKRTFRKRIFDDSLCAWKCSVMCVLVFSKKQGKQKVSLVYLGYI